MSALWLSLLGLMAVFTAWAADGIDVHSRMEEIKKKKEAVAQTRGRIEQEMAELMEALRRLDHELIEARKKHRAAAKELARIRATRQSLKAKESALRLEIASLLDAMQVEVAVAYRHSFAGPAWAFLTFGGDFAELPHRRAVMASVLADQERERKQLRKATASLKALENEMARQERELSEKEEALRLAETDLQRKTEEKRGAWRKLRNDREAKKRLEAALAQELEKLEHLLEERQAGLKEDDFRVRWSSPRTKRGGLPWPIRGKIVKRFGSLQPDRGDRLKGVLLVPTQNDRKVRAIAGGHVRYADWFGSFGLLMILDHGDGLMSLYAHNDALFKHAGDWVEAGEVIAEAGSTGWVEGVRLYFELRDRGKAVDPAKWCRR